MKKLLSLLLAALMLAPLCSAAPADAAAKVNISVDAIGEVARGTAGVELCVFVSELPRWSALQATVGFDAEALSFVGFELNPELRRQIEEGEMCIFGVNDAEAASGSVSFGYASAFAVGGAEGYHPGDYDYFGTLSFDVRADAPLGTTAVTLEVAELSRTEEDEPVPVAYSVTAGGMTLICVHDWQLAESVPVSCLADGFDRFVCRLCGDERTEVHSAIGHDWSEWEESKAPGCLENGVETRVCINDPTHVEYRPVSPLGHAWGEWETVSEATCVAKEVQRRVCERDGTHIETREVGEFDLENGHSWGEWTETSAATCTEAAVETRVCANDPEHTETREGRPALDHDWGEWTVTAEANCVRGAIETRVCSRDGSHYETRETGEAIPDAHDWGEWEVTVPATVFSDGEEARVCRNDPSHIEKRVILKPEYVVCDVDFDGEITVSDALRALRIAAGLDEADELTRAAADADSDGEITVADALAILRKALGLTGE